MSFLDDAAGQVNKYADKANSLLNAATGKQETTQAAGKIKYIEDAALNANDANQGGSAAPAPSGAGKPVGFDFGIPTEFIHLSHVHADAGTAFAHDSLKPPDVTPPLDAHAIMFRDALEREAILMFGFISSCKIAVQDTTKQRGAVEELAGMASNLLGGGNKTAKPDPAQLDTFISKIKTEAGKINKAQILYKETHECGKQFHLIRGDYQAFCDSLDAFYLKPPKSEGLGAIGDAIGGAAASLPGVGKILGVVQRIAFKFLDLYLAAFLELRKNHEKTIETAVHKLTIDAIKDRYQEYNPVYAVWFKKPEKKEEEVQTVEEEKKNKNSVSIDSDKYTKPVTDAIEEKKKQAEDFRNDVYDFAGANGTPETTPGSTALADAFKALRGGDGNTDPNAVPTATACIIKGLDATLSDIGGVPGFMKTVIGEIMDGNIALLEDVLARLMAQDAKAPINSAMLLKSGRIILSDKITKAFSKLVFGMITGGNDLTTDSLTKNPGTVGTIANTALGGKQLSAQQFMAKELEDKLGKYVEPVLQLCIGDLGGQLAASQKKAQEMGAQTMEVYLGRLPWLVAMMFRNTFFPIWNLVAEEVMGKVSPPLKSALKAINEPINKARDGVDRAQEYTRRAQNTERQVGETVDQANKVKDEASSMNVGTGPQGQKDLQDVQREKDNLDREIQETKDAPSTETQAGKDRAAEREAMQAEQENLEKFYNDNDKDKEFPIASTRIVEGIGEKLKADDEIPSVLIVTA